MPVHLYPTKILKHLHYPWQNIFLLDQTQCKCMFLDVLLGYFVVPDQGNYKLETEINKSIQNN